jgi:hypothetical protein
MRLVATHRSLIPARPPREQTALRFTRTSDPPRRGSLPSGQEPRFPRGPVVYPWSTRRQNAGYHRLIVEQPKLTICRGSVVNLTLARPALASPFRTENRGVDGSATSTPATWAITAHPSSARRPGTAASSRATDPRAASAWTGRGGDARRGGPDVAGRPDGWAAGLSWSPCSAVDPQRDRPDLPSELETGRVVRAVVDAGVEP